MTYKHGVLPGKDELERIYLSEGLSFAQIAARYDVRTKTVYNTMKRRANKAGTRWPLKRGTQHWQARRAAKHSEVAWDGVTAVMVKAEIKHALDTLGVTQADIARAAAVHPSTVNQIASGKRVRCARATALAITEAIGEMETARRRKLAAANALGERRAQIKAAKAAGTRPLSQRDLIEQRRRARLAA